MTIDISLFRDTIDVLTISGTTRYGVPQTTTVASGVPARAHFGNQAVVVDEGQELVSNVQFRIQNPQGYTVDAGDFVLFEDSHYKLLEVRRPRDDHAISHHTLMGRLTKEIT